MNILEENEINLSSFEHTSGGLGVIIKGINSHLTMLGGVCTGRFLQALPDYSNKVRVEKELDIWIYLLENTLSALNPEYKGFKDDYDTYKLDSPLVDFSSVFYKPQMLCYVTNNEQVRVIEGLKSRGFVPSPVVTNVKYGEECGLIMWTYAINGWEK